MNEINDKIYCIENNGSDCWVDDNDPEYTCPGIELCTNGRRITIDDILELQEKLSSLEKQQCWKIPDEKLKDVEYFKCVVDNEGAAWEFAEFYRSEFHRMTGHVIPIEFINQYYIVTEPLTDDKEKNNENDMDN